MHDDVISISKWSPVTFKYNVYRFIHNELPKQITERFHIGQILGSGAFGKVYSVHETRSCARYALKFVMKPLEADGEQLVKAANEVNILQSLKHPCIITIYEKIPCVEEGIGMLLEMMVGGDLHTRITFNEFLREDNAKFFFYQICTGVKYLHDLHVVHRDIKPENILLATRDANTLIKITDFGLSKMIKNNSVLRTVCGTPIFVAPEILNTNQETDTYTNKVDIWSLGILLVFALSGMRPSYNAANVTFCADPRNNVTATVQSLMKKMLSLDPNYRLSIDQVLVDLWMQDKKVIDAANAVMNRSNDASHRSRSPL